MTELSFPFAFPTMLPNSRDQELSASFEFLNRKELDWTLAALNRLPVALEGLSSAEEEDFFLFLDAFQAFCLSL